ncbi:orotidine-5'-phosphate decarboxylase [Helcococcus ovis]|uniref:orotidine-5'-phosphate decarboxylase n=1 Tax=Helcococcus TaxID=31983 RepID=UPI0038B98471
MNKCILALDFENAIDAVSFLDNFDEPIYVKVGMELFYGSGLQLINEIKNRGHNIFVDLKLHDIPNTVKGAMRNLAKLGVDMVNVHCAGGISMMKAAIEGLEEGKLNKKRPLCIGVTQLTSISQEIMNEELLIKGNITDTVLHYAINATKAGLDGVVCSVYESKIIHEVCGNDFLTITPGIRLKGDCKDDQKRVATPELAKEEGSDFIVVGRSITRSKNPNKTYIKIENIMRG